MNLLDAIKRILNFQDWKESSELPGWRSRPSRMKKARTPFGSHRQRGPMERLNHLEEFDTREERNERYRQLRERGTKHISKFTVSRASGEQDSKGREQGRIVWCVVRP